MTLRHNHRKQVQYCMKCIAAIVISACCLAGPGLPSFGSDKPEKKAAKPESISINRLVWLTGRWQGPRNGGLLEESWLPPRANTVTAVVRLTKNDLTEFVEIIKITETEDALELRLRLFGSDLNLLNEEPHVFKAINQQKHSITFRGVSKSAHRTLRYELVAPGRFDISWESQEGQRTVIHLSLAKAKSKHPPQKKN